MGLNNIHLTRQKSKSFNIIIRFEEIFDFMIDFLIFLEFKKFYKERLISKTKEITFQNSETFYLNNDTLLSKFFLLSK